MENNRLVSSLLDGRHKRFFPVDAFDWSHRAPVAVLRNQRTRAFYELVQDQPGAVQAELARRAGIHPSAAAWHLGRLARVGLVGEERQGRRVHYYPAKNSIAGADRAMEVA